jgi:hypothetical protein
MNRQESRERKKQIYRLQQEGKKLTEISAQYGLSVERVRNLCCEVKFEEETLPALPPFMQRLSARSRNCLSLYFGGDQIFFDPERIVALGRAGLLRYKNLGKKSVDEISAVLEELGYIKDIEKWYGRMYRGKDRGMMHIGDTWIVSIRSFLNEKGKFPPKMPHHEISRARHLGRIIEAATNPQDMSAVSCRRRPGNRKCAGHIKCDIMQDERIHYHCPVCGDNGIISDWQNTIWDNRPASTASLP